MKSGGGGIYAVTAAKNIYFGKLIYVAIASYMIMCLTITSASGLLKVMNRIREKARIRRIEKDISFRKVSKIL